MAFINIGSPVAGLKKGFNYDLQFMRNLVWASRSGNGPALEALVHIAATNAQELGQGAATVPDHILMAIMLDHDDPTKGSRQLMHDFEAKYGNH